MPARAFLRALHQLEPDPGAIITRMNSLLEHDMADDAFMSFIYARLGPDGSCSLVNAGHEVPLHYRPGLGFLRIDVGGLLMGLLPDMDYRVTAIESLQPGAVRVLFTDGIFEAQAPPAYEQYGQERMRAVVEQHAGAGAAAVREALVSEVDRWLAGHAQHDDMTLVVVERVS